MSLQKFSNLKWLLLSLIIIALDQVTKLIITLQFSNGDEKTILPFFKLVLWHNNGAAFSFLSDASGWQRWLFTGIAIGISFAMVLWLFAADKSQRMLSIALSLIIGGAIGNVIDRFNYGYVIDFLYFHIGSWGWPAFNIADSAVCIGAVLLFISLWKSK